MKTATSPVLFALWCLLVPGAASAQEAEPAAQRPATLVIPTGEGESFVSPDDLTTMTLLVNPQSTTATQAAVSLLEAAPGAVVPEHDHPASTEILVVIEGNGTMTLAGVAQPVETGMTIAIPPGIRHSYVNDGEGALRAVQVYTPAGPEARFRSWTPLLPPDDETPQ